MWVRGLERNGQYFLKKKKRKVIIFRLSLMKKNKRMLKYEVDGRWKNTNPSHAEANSSKNDPYVLWMRKKKSE
jgi:hypothetical protein